MSNAGSFKPGIHFGNTLNTISKQIYDTPFAFLRENVQNAVDASRIQSYRDQASPRDMAYRVDVEVDGKEVRIRDRGIGMSRDELAGLFWTIGASGKHTDEARDAGCVGMFGIGGFANFGVCDVLEVVSKRLDESNGTSTRLTRKDIDQAEASIPDVIVSESPLADPQGTVVIGTLIDVPDLNQLKTYLRDFVQYVDVPVFFDGECISQKKIADLEERENLKRISDSEQVWQHGGIELKGSAYEDNGHNIVFAIESIVQAGKEMPMVGYLRMINGALNVLKRGFKLCTTRVASQLGLSGRLDSDLFVPTAGRDSLDAPTATLLNQINSLVEQVALSLILEDENRIAQNARIFPLVLRLGWIDKLGKAVIDVADGSSVALDKLRRLSESGAKVFYGNQKKHALNQVMVARGHQMVILPNERHRQQAYLQYLLRFCAAQPFEGVIECHNRYEDLTRFEKVFLSELEFNISRAYEIREFRVVAGELTEDVPAFVDETKGNDELTVFVDVRHSEVAKLESLGIGSLLYSMIGRFCREYLGGSLRKWSPRFFGDGAINIDLLAKRRSELWVLLKDDIGTIQKSGQRTVVRRADVQSVTVQSGTVEPPKEGKPRILQIIDPEHETNLAGYYIRLPDNGYKAYGDIVLELENRGLVWVGNKLTYVTSDGISSAFQYEIRLDQLITPAKDGEASTIGGAWELQRPLQQLHEGIYFPIPSFLEAYLVPAGSQELRLELYCELTDLTTSRQWSTEADAEE
ncbi:MAG: ATP-binding protein [Pseudomonadota bacterium]